METQKCGRARQLPGRQQSRWRSRRSGGWCISIKLNGQRRLTAILRRTFNHSIFARTNSLELDSSFLKSFRRPERRKDVINNVLGVSVRKSSFEKHLFRFDCPDNTSIVLGDCVKSLWLGLSANLSD